MQATDFQREMMALAGIECQPDIDYAAARMLLHLWAINKRVQEVAQQMKGTLNTLESRADEC
jgi:hypothetical protein